MPKQPNTQSHYKVGFRENSHHAGERHGTYGYITDLFN